MNTKHRRAVDTRRLYRFENLFMPDVLKPGVKSSKSADYLQGVADTVWVKHGRNKMNPPKIQLVDEPGHSWCLGYSDIFLTRNPQKGEGTPHDTVCVLLHELTHAMGYSTHGKGFVNKYIELLVEYGGCSEDELRLGLTLFNIRA